MSSPSSSEPPTEFLALTAPTLGPESTGTSVWNHARFRTKRDNGLKYHLFLVEWRARLVRQGSAEEEEAKEGWTYDEIHGAVEMWRDPERKDFGLLARVVFPEVFGEGGGVEYEAFLYMETLLGL